jgi:hypothetical protein
MVGLLLLRSLAEEVESNGNLGIHSPIGFCHLFGSQSLQNEEFDDDVVFVVQVGFMGQDGYGKLLRYIEGASSSRVIYKTRKVGAIPVAKLDRVDLDKEFKKLIASLVQSAPTNPIGIDEAVGILHSGGGNTWLFEYIDPFRGKQSIVTVEDLPEHLSVRNHDHLRNAFEKVVQRVLEEESSGQELNKPNQVEGASEISPR